MQHFSYRSMGFSPHPALRFRGRSFQFSMSWEMNPADPCLLRKFCLLRSCRKKSERRSRHFGTSIWCNAETFAPRVLRLPPIFQILNTRQQTVNPRSKLSCERLNPSSYHHAVVRRRAAAKLPRHPPSSSKKLRTVKVSGLRD